MFGRLRISFLILMSGISCSSVPKTMYEDDGLNFKITEDFRIGWSDSYKQNSATYIPIHGRNKNVYAEFSVIWLPCLSDLDWEIQNYVDGLNSVYANDANNKPEYREIRSTKFGSNDARQIEYVVPNDGPRVGSYTVFHCNGSTVIIGQHCTVETQAMTQRCRDLIEATYSCAPSQGKKLMKSL